MAAMRERQLTETIVASRRIQGRRMFNQSLMLMFVANLPAIAIWIWDGRIFAALWCSLCISTMAFIAVAFHLRQCWRLAAEMFPRVCTAQADKITVKVPSERMSFEAREFEWAYSNTAHDEAAYFLERQKCILIIANDGRLGIRRIAVGLNRVALAEWELFLVTCTVARRVHPRRSIWPRIISAAIIGGLIGAMGCGAVILIEGVNVRFWQVLSVAVLQMLFLIILQRRQEWHFGPDGATMRCLSAFWLVACGSAFTMSHVMSAFIWGILGAVAVDASNCLRTALGDVSSEDRT